MLMSIIANMIFSFGKSCQWRAGVNFDFIVQLYFKIPASLTNSRIKSLIQIQQSDCTETTSHVKYSAMSKVSNWNLISEAIRRNLNKN